MALPSIEQVSQTINGVTVPCAHITCTEAANFRMENVLDTINSGSFTFQSVMRSNANRNIVIAVGNKEATYELTNAWAKFVTLYEDVDPQTGGRDMNIFFPAGEYWLYHTMLEHGNKVSDWKVSPEDTEEQIAQVYVEIREQYTQIMSDTERILLEALSSYTKVSDFETFKTENTAAIELKADEITSTVAATYQTKTDASNMQTQISQNATALAGKVSVNDYTAAQIALMINQAGEGEAIISAEHIQLRGDVVLEGDLTTAGGVAINGENITAGTIGANQIAANSISVDKLTGQIKDSGETWTIDLARGTMTIGNISAANIDVSSGKISANQIDVSSINIDAAQINNGTIAVARIPTLTANKIDASDLQVSAANITGQLTASQIDASNLKVAAANITGQLTASQINASNLQVAAANITGTLTANQINSENLHVSAANVDGDITASGVNVTSGDKSYAYIDLRSTGNNYTKIFPASIEIRDADALETLDATLSINGLDGFRAKGQYGQGKYGNVYLCHSDGLYIGKSSRDSNYEETATIDIDGKATFTSLYIGATSLDKLLSNTLIAAKQYTDASCTPPASGEGAVYISSWFTNMSSGKVRMFRYGPLCVACVWFTATGAITSGTTGNNVVEKSYTISGETDGNFYAPLTSYNQSDSTGQTGYFYVNVSGAIGIRVSAAGDYYGCIAYPVR